MSSITQLQNESQPLIVGYWDHGKPQPEPSVAESPADNVYVVEFSPAKPALTADSGDFDSLLSELESNPESAKELADGRRWVQQNFYSGEAGTLRSARLSKGFSQQKLADLLGTSQSHIANIESGKNNLLLTTAVKLCEMLDVDLRDLPGMIAAQGKANNEGKR